MTAPDPQAHIALLEQALEAEAARKLHPGRKPLPESLPRVENILCADANCKTCGGTTALIGYDESQVLDVEPAHWFVRLTKREKREWENVRTWRCQSWSRAWWRRAWRATRW